MHEWSQEILKRLASLKLAPAREAEIVEEVSQHLEDRYRELVAGGATEEQARRMALEELSDEDLLARGLRRVEQAVRQEAVIAGATGQNKFLPGIWEDIRYGLRMLRKNPSFTAVGIVTLAIGIGANTAIFSVVDSLLLRPLPVADPGRLVVIASKVSDSTLPHRVSYPDYLDLRNQERIFSDVIAYEVAPVNLSGQPRPERIWVEGVTPNYFSMLGVAAIRGRMFVPETSDSPGREPVLVLSYAFWQRHYFGDAGVVGRIVHLNSQPFTVVGVAPEGFPGTEPLVAVDAYVPLEALHGLPPESLAALHQRDNRGFRAMARLRAGTSQSQAMAEVQLLAHQLELEYPKTNEGVSFTLVPEMRSRPDPADATFIPQIVTVFMTLVGLVLVIACANFAGLLLAHASVREREMAVRAALGASRRRLARQQITEGVLFGLLGGGAGLVLAVWVASLLSAIKLPTDIPVTLFTPSLDWRLFAFTLTISIMTGVLASLIPSIHASRLDLSRSLKEGTRTGGESRSRIRFRSVLVVSQIAVSVLLLVCSGLFIRSLKNAEQTDLGFQTDHLLMLSVDVGMQSYEKARALRFYEELAERVNGRPWTRSVSLARFVPFGNENGTYDIYTEERSPASREPPLRVFYNVVGLDYFETVATPLTRGREFSKGDNESSPKVAVVSEATARALWPGKDPVGRRLELGRDGPWAEVAGVAQNIKFTFPFLETQLLVYLPLSQNYQSEITLVVRTVGDPKALLGAARHEVFALDQNLPCYDVKTMATHIREGVALLPIRLAATLVGTFGLVGLILAVVGLYGVVSYFVARRTHEIGVRMALGAQERDVLRLVVGQGLRLTIIGVALGLGVAFALTRFLASLLYGVSATDPLTFILVLMLFAGATVLAAVFPARRATKVDPMVALRYE
jgi:predicted permease